MDFQLLKTLCAIHAPSGNEAPMHQFIVNYVAQNSHLFKVQPTVYTGPHLGDAVVLAFGKPTTAIFSHIDSIGFTVRYDNNVVRIGGPVTENGFALVGEDSLGKIETTLVVETTDDGKVLKVDHLRPIDRGTELTFKPDFREDNDFVQCCYMDNRLGCYVALKVAETLENGLICFTTYEEVGGGNAAAVGRFINDEFKVNQALIADITWVTEGVHPGQGVAISMRDSGIPRRSFLNKIIDLAIQSGIPYQLEVESSGGSDGIILHKSPYSFDWLFIGAPEEHVHSPNEKVNKADIKAMIELYSYLMKEL